MALAFWLKFLKPFKVFPSSGGVYVFISLLIMLNGRTDHRRPGRPALGLQTMTFLSNCLFVNVAIHFTLFD